MKTTNINNNKMTSSSVKNQLIQNYLNTSPDQPDKVEEMPTQQELDDFKQHVQVWLEYDTAIKKLAEAAKKHKNDMKPHAQKIQEFMRRFNIDDINTKDGKLKCRVSQVKAPIPQAEIKNRLLLNYNPEASAEDLTKTIFEKDRQTTEKVSLRRSK